MLRVNAKILLCHSIYLFNLGYRELYINFDLCSITGSTDFVLNFHDYIVP